MAGKSDEVPQPNGLDFARVQIAFFTYVFVNGWQLGVVGVLQMVAYSAFVLFTGVFVFKESFTVTRARMTQYLGFILAVSGVVLINL